MKIHAAQWLAIVEACLLVALGVQLINASDLLVGGTAGLGLILLQFVPDLTFGQIFFLVNLPFYLIALRYLGVGFTLRTFGAVTLLSVFADLIEHNVSLELAHPLIASVLGGLLIGLGLTFLIRAQASLGGITILAVFLERRLGINAAKTTLTTDMGILMFGFVFFDALTVCYSIVAFIAVGSVMGRYRKPAFTPPEEAALTVESGKLPLKQDAVKA